MPRGDKFDQALVYAVRELGQVNVTKLEKLLYLADLEHFHRTGFTLTPAKWVRFTLGPLAKRLVHSRAELAGHEIALSAEVQGAHEAQVYRPGPAPRFDPAFTEVERRTLDRTISMARPLNADEMIRLAYNTTPMRFLLAKEQGKPHYNVPIPFELNMDVVSQTVGQTPIAGSSERAQFKLGELARVSDLQDAILAAAGSQ